MGGQFLLPIACPSTAPANSRRGFLFGSPPIAESLAFDPGQYSVRAPAKQKKVKIKTAA
jgi:hypothetical protein